MPRDGADHHDFHGRRELPDLPPEPAQMPAVQNILSATRALGLGTTLTSVGRRRYLDGAFSVRPRAAASIFSCGCVRAYRYSCGLSPSRRRGLLECTRATQREALSRGTESLQTLRWREADRTLGPTCEGVRHARDRGKAPGLAAGGFASILGGSAAISSRPPLSSSSPGRRAGVVFSPARRRLGPSAPNLLKLCFPFRCGDLGDCSRPSEPHSVFPARRPGGHCCSDSTARGGLRVVCRRGLSADHFSPLVPLGIRSTLVAS
jgi:hypothetical protein